MSKILSSASIAERQAERYPNAGGGDITVEIQAKGETAESIQAAAVKSFSQSSGRLQTVKALDHFYVGAGQVVQKGDFAEVKDSVARQLIAAGRAEAATPEEIQAAQLADEAAAAKAKK